MRKISTNIVLLCIACLLIVAIYGCNVPAINNDETTLDNSIQNLNDSILDNMILDFNEVDLDSNVASKHCVCNGKIYFDKYVLDVNKFILVDDSLSSGVNEVTIESLTSDGAYVYYLVTDLALTDEGLDLDGTIMRWDGTEMLEIARWDRPLSGSNNRSMKRNGDYIYFFRENDNGSNFVSRVRYDGGEVEALCENKTDKNYTGIYFIDDSVYVQYNRNLYKTDIEHLSPDDLTDDKLILSNVQRIFLHNDCFYYVSYANGGAATNLYSMTPDSGDKTLVIENIYEMSLIFVDNKIYFSYYNPEKIGDEMLDGKEQIIYNQTHGSVYCYDIETGNITDVAIDLDIVFDQIYNVSDSCILAEAYTNEQYAAESSGHTRQYMLVPTDGSEAIILEMGT